MPDPITATIGVGATLLTLDQANKAGARADKANKKALQFDMKKYDDWKKIYGPIEQNLSNYYQTLSPESYTAQGFQGIEAEFSKVKQNIEEQIAQRGLTDSGIAAATDQNLQIQKALAKAKVRQEAPAEIAKQKTAFLQGGEQRRSQAEQGISMALHNQASRADANAASAANAFGNLLNLGLSNLPGINTETAGAASAATTATMRA
jgi:hypothetical protein